MRGAWKREGKHGFVMIQWYIINNKRPKGQAHKPICYFYSLLYSSVIYSTGYGR